MNNQEREALWHDRLTEVAKFVGKNKRNPSSSITEEAPLASWFTMQRVRLRSGNMRPDRAVLLDEHLPQWRDTKSRTSRFEDNVQDYVEFLTSNGRAPVSTSEDEDEKRLAIWMSNQKAQARRNEASASSIAALDKAVPGWNEWQRKAQNRASNYPKWDENLILLDNFIKENVVKPVFECEDKEERRLAAWLNNQRRMFRKNLLAQERVDKLDKLIPNWNNLSRNAGKWSLNASQSLAFIKANGTAPSVSSEDAAGRKLARWFADQRRKATTDPALANLLDENLPGWRDVKTATNVQSWEETLTAAAQYVDANGAYPATTSTDPGERRIGFWMTRNRKYLKDGRLSEMKRSKLDTLLPQWKTGTVKRAT